MRELRQPLFLERGRRGHLGRLHQRQVQLLLAGPPRVDPRRRLQGGKKEGEMVMWTCGPKWNIHTGSQVHNLQGVNSIDQLKFQLVN